MLFRTLLVAGLMMAGSAGALADRAGAPSDAERQARRQQWIAQHDRNKDGKLDDVERAEARRARMAKRFAMLDADKNGTISWTEFEKARTRERGRGGRHHRRCGNQGAGGGGGTELAPTSLMY